LYKPELTSKDFFGLAFLVCITSSFECPPEEDKPPIFDYSFCLDRSEIIARPGESFDLRITLTRYENFYNSTYQLYGDTVYIAAEITPCLRVTPCIVDEYLLARRLDPTYHKYIDFFVFDRIQTQFHDLTLSILPNAPLGQHIIEFYGEKRPSPNKENLTLTVAGSSPDFWEPTLGGGPAASIRALAVTPGGALLAGSNGSGAFRSVDNGDNWTAVIGLNNTFVTSFAIKGTDLFLGSGGGVYRSTNDGVNWTEKINGLGSNTEVSALAIGTNGDIFAGANEDFNNQGGVYRSTNNGDSWMWSFNGGQNTLVESLVSNSNGDIFAGTLSGLYRSTNQGQNWSPIANAPTIRSLAINPINGHMFGGRLSQSYRSTDNGMNWQAITIHPTNPDARSFAFNSSGHVFAATLGFNSNDRRGVFRSTDFGITWEEINGGLPNTNAYSFTINSSRTLFVGTEEGVYRSINPVAFKPVDITRKHN